MISRMWLITKHNDHLNSLLVLEALKIVNDPAHHFNSGKHTRNMDRSAFNKRTYEQRRLGYSLVSALFSAVLGPKPVTHYTNGNTALAARLR